MGVLLNKDNCLYRFGCMKILGSLGILQRVGDEISFPGMRRRIIGKSMLEKQVPFKEFYEFPSQHQNI